MKRVIGIWRDVSEREEKCGEVGELIIDGNNLQFYTRFIGKIFRGVFIGKAENFSTYKVFTDDDRPRIINDNRSIDYSYSSNIVFALKDNVNWINWYDDKVIDSFSFSVPELTKWLDVYTIGFGKIENEEMVIYEKTLPSIVLHEKNPFIEIYYESTSMKRMAVDRSKTSAILEKYPKIRVCYEESKDINDIYREIHSIVQFLGLIIGKISTVDDIYLYSRKENKTTQLFFNKDFSYNSLNYLADINEKNRYLIDKIEYYYKNWRKFHYNSKFDLIRNIYFDVNTKKNICAEDILVAYIRILEGYHIRISNDEENKKDMECAIKECSKKIKQLIFTEEIRLELEAAIQQVKPEWKMNSKHKTTISKWIAQGFVSKKGLTERIKELDQQNFDILRTNSNVVERQEYEDKSDEEIEEIYFKEIVQTRNYYSHFKLDKTGVLKASQMNPTINALKAIILSIFYKKMGMEKDEIRRQLAFNEELEQQTIHLLREGDYSYFNTDDLKSSYFSNETIRKPQRRYSKKATKYQRDKNRKFCRKRFQKREI